MSVVATSAVIIHLVAVVIMLFLFGEESAARSVSLYLLGVLGVSLLLILMWGVKD